MCYTEPLEVTSLVIFSSFIYELILRAIPYFLLETYFYKKIAYSLKITAQYFDAVFSERELALTFVICRRPAVCLSSVTFVHPTQTIETFGNFSMPLGTLLIH